MPRPDVPAAPRPGEELDLDALEHYLATTLGTSGAPQVAQFPSGFSNLTYAVRCDGREFVLRRPPFGAAIASAHDMGREHRILSALAPVYPKAPGPVAYCDDLEVLGSPFYLMERRTGIILRATSPPEDHPSATDMGRIAAAWTDTLVELHELDPAAIGLENLDRGEGYVGRQIAGWSDRWQRARIDDVASIESAASWLAGRQPSDRPHRLIHNDFKYDNVVLDPRDLGRVTAVLDWEMATVGDPWMDLGTALGYWVDPDDSPVMHRLALSPTALPGNPPRVEIAERYAVATGVDASEVVFYFVFGLFKIAVIVQQIYARYRQGLTADPRFAQLDRAVAALGTAATRAIELDRIDRLF